MLSGFQQVSEQLNISSPCTVCIALHVSLFIVFRTFIVFSLIFPVFSLFGY